MVHSVVVPKGAKLLRCRFPLRPSHHGRHQPSVRRVLDASQFALLAREFALPPFGSYQNLGRRGEATPANHRREEADLGAPRTTNHIEATELLPGLGIR
jgi:hypothetical protein